MPEPITQNDKVAFLEVMVMTLLAEEPDDERLRSIMQEFRAGVEKIIARPKKGAVNSLFSDFSEMCRGSSIEMRKSVSAALQSRCGHSLSYFERARIDRIARIVTRGRIRTDDEWRLVEERIQELCEEEAGSSECEVLDRLLWQYKPKAEA